MKILLAGMHSTPNQFTRGIHKFGCHWIHWHGGKARENLPTNCDAVLIARCQISHHGFWEAKETYLGMKKPIFVSLESFSEVAEPIQEWLKDVGHLDAMGNPKKKIAPKNTAMAHAFKQAEKIEPKTKPQEKSMPVMTEENVKQWEKMKPLVDPIIKAMHDAGHQWADIADALNKKHLKTKTGFEWTGATANSYSLANSVVTRRINTAGGLAGSTGDAPPKPKRRSPTRKSDDGGVSDQEIEEIMTSNLHTALKMKVIRLLANARG